MTHFIDTNVFVYQFDDRDPAKRNRARMLIRASLDQGDGICSTQVVNEFCNLALRRFAVPLTPAQCTMYVDTVLAPLCTVGWSQALVREALRMVERWQASWYDALIIAGASEGGASILYSEDLQHGMQYGTVRVRNPFLPPD